MKPPNWSKEDFEVGLRYLACHEEETQVSPIINTKSGVTVILPCGLPALGVTFHGIFMAAPIWMFAFLLVTFLAIGVAENWGVNLITLALMALCFILLWGLGKALKLLLKSRELFPRRHFVTLGKRGIAMHYNRLQIPFSNPRTAIPWEEVARIRRGGKCLFPFALLYGITAAEIFEVDGREGKVIIPFCLRKDKSANLAGAIEKSVETEWKRSASINDT